MKVLIVQASFLMELFGTGAWASVNPKPLNPKSCRAIRDNVRYALRLSEAPISHPCCCFRVFRILMEGLIMGHVYNGLYRVDIGIMEKNMETTIMGLCGVSGLSEA